MKLKKIITTLFATTMLVGATMNVFSNDKATLTANVTGNTAHGGEITVSIDTSKITNLGGTNIALTYDNTKLEYVSGEITDEFKGVAGDVVNQDDTVSIYTVYNDSVNTNGSVAKLKFKILAEGGSAVELGLTASLIDIDTYEEISVEVSGTSFIVDAPMTGVVIEGSKDISLLKGETSILIAKIIPDNTTETNRAVKWTSSNTGVATVDNTGVVTAVGAGTAIITVTTEVGGYTATATVSVSVKLTGIKIQTSTTTIDEGKTVSLNVIKVPNDTTETLEDVKWKSVDESIAVVDANGVVTAIKAGTVTIIAEAGDFSDEITITINETETETTTANTKENNVKTGDDVNVGVLVVMAICSLAVGAIAYKKCFIGKIIYNNRKS